MSELIILIGAGSLISSHLNSNPDDSCVTDLCSANMNQFSSCHFPSSKQIEIFT
jgi:hypothetical protein